jgi:hypothetical protein
MLPLNNPKGKCLAEIPKGKRDAALNFAFFAIFLPEWLN